MMAITNLLKKKMNKNIIALIKGQYLNSPLTKMLK